MAGSAVGRIFEGRGLGANGGSPPRAPGDVNQVVGSQAAHRVMGRSGAGPLGPRPAVVGAARPGVMAHPVNFVPPPATALPAPSPYGPFHDLVANAHRLGRIGGGVSQDILRPGMIDPSTHRTVLARLFGLI